MTTTGDSQSVTIRGMDSAVESEGDLFEDTHKNDKESPYPSVLTTGIDSDNVDYDEGMGGLDDAPSLTNVLWHPKRMITRACQLFASRSKPNRPRQQTRMKQLGKAKGNGKEEKKREKPKRKLQPKGIPSKFEIRDEIIEDVSDRSIARHRSEGGKLDHREVSELLETLTKDPEADLDYKPSSAAIGCCRCGLLQSPFFAPGEYQSSSAQFVQIGAGRFFGRASLPYGSYLLHSSFSGLHSHASISRDDPPRPSSSRTMAPTRSPVLRRSKSMTKRTEMPRHSPSSPLPRGPIHRIDRLDVLTPDSHFLPTMIASPVDQIEGEDSEETQSTPQSVLPDTTQQQIAELQLQLALLRTETEMQRKEREKYQRLYESTALCLICMERRRDAFILPCSHFVYCVDCLERHWQTQRFRQCPMCRGPANSVIHSNLV